MTLDRALYAAAAILLLFLSGITVIIACEAHPAFRPLASMFAVFFAMGVGIFTHWALHKE